KFIKYKSFFVVWDTDTMISNRKNQISTLFFQLHIDHSTGWRILYCILNKVGNNVRNGKFIGFQLDMFIQIRFNNLRFASILLQAIDDLFYQFGHIKYLFW